MIITCTKCGHEFEPDTKKQQFILESAAKGMSFAMIPCPNCPVGTEIDPVAIVGGNASSGSEATAPLRCPVLRCTGYVSHVEPGDEDAFWGCGACGSVWYQLASLFNEIESISSRYSYRKKCYSKKGNQWLPSGKEPKNYEKRVETEPSGIDDDFVRD